MPAGIARVLLAQGAVYVRTTRALLDAGLSLDVGDQRSHFREVPEDKLASFGIPMEYRPELDPDALGTLHGAVAKPPAESDAEGESEAEAPAPMVVKLNEMQDWALPDHNTLQFRLNAWDQPLRYDVASPIVLPQQEEELEFSALLGAHRAAARLQLRLEDENGVILHTADLPFDVNHHGGTHMIGYKEVRTVLPPSAGSCKLWMTMIFDRYTGKAGEPEPYLFIADPNVQRKARPDAVPAEELHTNPGAEGLGMVWASAELAAELRPSDDLSLIVGEGGLSAEDRHPDPHGTGRGQPPHAEIPVLGTRPLPVPHRRQARLRTLYRRRADGGAHPQQLFQR